jgi:hypothetical protein
MPKRKLNQPSTSTYQASTSSNEQDTTDTCSKKSKTNNLLKKFNSASKSKFNTTLHISELKFKHEYFVHDIRKIETKFGLALVSTISFSKDEEKFNVFLPSRFSDVFTEDELKNIDFQTFRLIVEGKLGKTYDVKLINVD